MSESTVLPSVSRTSDLVISVRTARDFASFFRIAVGETRMPCVVSSQSQIARSESPLPARSRMPASASGGILKRVFSAAGRSVFFGTVGLEIGRGPAVIVTPGPLADSEQPPALC
jgi:hypothetical protein